MAHLIFDVHRGDTGPCNQKRHSDEMLPEREPMPECYMPYLQHQYNGTTLSIVVRTAGDPNALAETVRRLARERAPSGGSARLVRPAEPIRVPEGRSPGSRGSDAA